MKDPYSTLGLPPDADEGQIRKAYRRLAREHHPDVNPDDPSAAERFKEISAAYRLLADPDQRQAYLCRHDPTPDFKTVWQEAASRPAPAPAPKESTETVASPGQDVQVRLFVTLEDLVSGVSRKIRVKRRAACPTCTGRGSVGSSCPSCRGSGRVPDLLAAGSGRLILCRKCSGTGSQNPSACGVCAGTGHLTSESAITVGVPPGAEDQSLIVIKGQGHEGLPGRPAGDLKVTVCVKNHAYLIRQGTDLIYRCRISLCQWLSGLEVRAPSLEGCLSLKIEPGSKSEGTLRVRSRGLPDAGGSRGDLLVQYKLALPSTLNRKQAALLKKLEETPGFNPPRDEEGFSSTGNENFTCATA
jgi:molecular chaperone DnaJ